MGEVGGSGGEGADGAAVDSTGQGACQEHKVSYCTDLIRAVEWYRHVRTVSGTDMIPTC